MARRKTGSIRKRGEGKFQVAVAVSGVSHYLLQSKGRVGFQHRRYDTVVGTREDAERRLHEMQYEADKGTLPTGRSTLNTWLDYWLREYVAAERRESTFKDYCLQVRKYVGPMLGAMYLRGHQAQPHPGVSEPASGGGVGNGDDSQDPPGRERGHAGGVQQRPHPREPCPEGPPPPRWCRRRSGHPQWSGYSNSWPTPPRTGIFL